MPDIPGLGLTHHPGMTMQGNLAARAKTFKQAPLLPERYPATTPGIAWYRHITLALLAYAYLE